MLSGHSGVPPMWGWGQLTVIFLNFTRFIAHRLFEIAEFNIVTSFYTLIITWVWPSFLKLLTDSNCDLENLYIKYQLEELLIFHLNLFLVAWGRGIVRKNYSRNRNQLPRKSTTKVPRYYLEKRLVIDIKPL